MRALVSSLTWLTVRWVAVVAAGLTVGAIGAYAADRLTTPSHRAIQAATDADTSCDDDGVTVTYGVAYQTATRSYGVVSVRVAGIAPACMGASLEVDLEDQNGNLLSGGAVTATVSGESMVLRPALSVAAAEVSLVNVSVAGTTQEQAPPTPTTTTTTPTTTTPVAPPPTPTTTSTPTITTTPAPIVNAPASTPATPDLPGSVAVAVAAPAPSSSSAAGGIPAEPPVTVSVAWPPGAFTVPVTVKVTPNAGLGLVAAASTSSGVQIAGPTAIASLGGATASNAPSGGGFALGPAVIQLNVTDDNGDPITSFPIPLQIHISASSTGDIPAFSEDGLSWTTLPRLTTPDLPADQPDGYFMDPDGVITIFTHHATYFGVLKDVRAPTPATMKIRLTGATMRLSWRGSKDNVRVGSYVVSRDGHGYHAEKRTIFVLPTRAGRYWVTTIDTSGNTSRPSRAVTVIRLPGAQPSFKVEG
ncbi:MAG TPA: hypothetical protein VG652_03105 [Gaiellaceae bacterium]|nr:hypothetical protein [Gaiellaceae bacterium]